VQPRRDEPWSGQSNALLRLLGDPLGLVLGRLQRLSKLAGLLIGREEVTLERREERLENLRAEVGLHRRPQVGLVLVLGPIVF